MNKITVRLNDDNKIISTLQKGKSTRELNENETLRLINRVSKKDTKVLYRTNPRTKVATLNLVGKGLNFNIVLENYVNVVTRAKDCNKKARKIKKNIVTGGSAATILAACGIGAAIIFSKTANHPYDPEIDSKITEEQTYENTQALPTITEEMLNQDNPLEFSDGTNVALDNDYIQIELDNNSVYDPGIEQRNLPFVEMIEQRANRWGISFDLLYDIVSQEYGGPNDKANICHVVFDSWKDQVISAYNNDTQRVEYIVLTDNPENYEKILEDRSNAGKPNCVDQTISREEIQNPETSLAVAGIILQFSDKYYKGNTPLAIQAFNNGVGTVDKIVNKTAEATGNTYDVIVADIDGVYWLKFRDVGQTSDPNYFYNVAKHVSERGGNVNTYSIKISRNGELFESLYKVINSGLVTEKDTTIQVVEEQGNAKGR